MFLLGAVNLNFDVSPNRYADGTLADVSVLVGTATWDEVGTAAASCSDYTSTSGSGMLLDTRSSRKLDIRSLGPSSCSASRLLCLQD